jgi:GNAT superfamily N-acetyltransferase
MTMTPRKARKADGPAVFALVWAARDDIPLDPDFYNDVNKKWISEFCKKGDVWVVEEAGTVIGAMVLSGNEVFYLVVSANHRRLGVGRTLLRKAKCKGRWVRVKPTNLAMIQLLEGEKFQRDPDHLRGSGWHVYRIQN